MLQSSVILINNPSKLQLPLYKKKYSDVKIYIIMESTISTPQNKVLLWLK